MLVAAALLALGGCAKGAAAARTPLAGVPAVDMSRVPAEFRAACGRPGADVTVKTVPVTVRHADCDLTGVRITYGLAGAYVPKPGTSASTVVDTLVATTDPTTITITVDAATQDVTVTS
jgi:hypothetical protein